MTEFGKGQQALKIRVIYPASGEAHISSGRKKLELEKNGFEIISATRDLIENQPNILSHVSGSIKNRVDELLQALSDENTDAIICGRGGYGASDLLDEIPWSKLKHLKTKPIVGFSDISALHAAFYTQLGWRSIHGPMLDTPYWTNSDGKDTNYLHALLAGYLDNGQLSLNNTSVKINQPISGSLFGGCLSVLTNLIGTDYIPSSLDGKVLFFEDINEPVGRILRNFNQWIQSKSLEGVRAIVLGRFFYDERDESVLIELANEMQSRSHIPVFSSLDFGHCTPNMPILIGANCSITNNQLHWKGRSREPIT
jgi:muramoyltetrapeptide carboxypeptidase